jgi:hypothetical protein
MTQPTLRFHDPRALPGAAAEPYHLALDPAHPLDGITVGLLANGFPDSVRFLGHLGEALAAAAPGIALEHYDKRDASSLASDTLLDRIGSSCRAVVAAYGH